MSLPRLEPCIFYGLTSGIKNNAWFISEEEVLYPVGGVLALHNYTTKSQKCIRISEPQKVLSIIALSPNRQFIAVGEKGEKPSISVYDVFTLSRKKILGLPFETQSQEFICLSFTCDNRYLVAVSGSPDWMLYYYNWEKGKVESSAKAISNLLHPGSIHDMATNPVDPTTVVLVGASLFRLLTIQESVWKQYGFQKADLLSFTSVCWISAERVMAGTRDGRLIFVENGELRASFNALELSVINFPPAPKEGEDSVESNSQAVAANITTKVEVASDIDRSVRCLSGFTKGFLYAITPGMVIVFGKETNLRYLKKNIFRVCAGEIKDRSFQDTYLIHCLCVSPEMNKLLCTTQRSQIFWTELANSGWNQPLKEKKFKLLGEKIHHGPIVSLSSCAWKSVFLTCGELDRTVSLWDYVTFQLLMSHTFQENVYSVSLHPSGLYAVIGFSDKLRFMLVLIDQLQVYHEFPIKGAQQVAFSTSGHLFAAADESTILIFSTVTFQTIFTFKGHSDAIKSMIWTENDGYLFSCGLDGAVYQWDTFHGKRVGDVASKNCQYSNVAVTSDAKTAFAIGNEGVISQIENSIVVGKIELTGSALDCIVLSERRKLLFVSSLNGVVLSVRFPLLQAVEFEEFSLHNNNVSCMVLTNDKNYLITTSIDGCLCIWKVITQNKYADSMILRSKEILISKDDLAEKINYISELKSRIVEMENEHEYVTKKMEAKFQEETTNLLNHYNSLIEEFKKKNHELETEHKVKLNKVQAEIAQMNEDHLQVIQNVENKYNRKLVEEYAKYKQFEEKVQSMKEIFENQMSKLREEKFNEVEKVKADYEAELSKKNQEISELREEMLKKDANHEEIKMQIEEDADREIISIKIDFEKELNKEKNNSVELRREVGVNKKKFAIAQKEIENYKQEINDLHLEHDQLENKIQTLEKDIKDIHREVSERDAIIQEKEKQISDIKHKITELEKVKYVLNYKINDLTHQVMPKDEMISKKNSVIEDMKNEIEDLQKESAKLKFQTKTAERKLIASKRELEKEQEKSLGLSLLLDKIRIDIYSTACCIQDPAKLKDAIRKLHLNYSASEKLEKAQEKQVATFSEFSEQRKYLESMIKSLMKSLKRESEKPTALQKKMLENSTLMEKISQFQNELKLAREKIDEYKKLTHSAHGESMKPQSAPLSKEKKSYEQEFKDYQATITVLKEEVENLKRELASIDKPSVAQVEDS